MRCQAFTVRLDERQSLDLQRLNDFLERVQPIQVSSALVAGSFPVWSILVFYEGEAPKGKERLEKPLPKPHPTADDALYQALREWRRQKAKAEGVPPYVIARDAQLAAIAEALPTSAEALAQIRGFGSRKAERYGEEILALLRKVRGAKA